MTLKMAVLALAWASFSGLACAQDLLSDFDPAKERDAQRAAVSQGRTIVTDFNSPLDYAGSVIFCDETAPGSKIYVPKGNGRFPIVKDREFTVDDLDEPKRVRRVIVKKNGSVLGWGGGVTSEKKRLVEVSTYESARAEVAAQLTGDSLKQANAALKLAGGKSGDTACYIWSVSKLSTKISVDEQRNINLNSPGIFVVEGQASFMRLASNTQRDDYATIIMSPFKLGLDAAPSTPAPPAGSAPVIASGSLVEPTKEEQAAAEKLVEIAREAVALTDRAAEAGVAFSADEQVRLESLTRDQVSDLAILNE